MLKTSKNPKNRKTKKPTGHKLLANVGQENRKNIMNYRQIDKPKNVLRTDDLLPCFVCILIHSAGSIFTIVVFTSELFKISQNLEQFQ